MNNSSISAAGIRRLLLLTVALLMFHAAAAVSVSAQAQDVYITPDGGGSGACTNNTHPPSWFNSSGNWGSGASQIGPGTIVHLCGTFSGAQNSTMFTVQGSGASGRPVTILFESGANLTSPAWSGARGAINISGHSYIVVDGGANGIIQNTNNGTNLGLHQAASVGVFAGGPSGSGCSPGCRITNLTVANMYIHTSASDCSIDQTSTNAVQFLNTAGIRIDHNVFHDMGWAINGWGSNIEIDHNDVYNIDHGTASGANANTVGGMFHDNHIHDFSNWDTNGNCYHHDGIHIWNSDPNTNSNIMIYNNRFDGDSGVNITGYVYTENKISNIKVFNNVFSLAAGRTMGGLLWMGNYYDVAPMILNNTFIGQGSSACIRLESNSGVVWQNNVVSGCNTFLSFVQNTSLSVGDYNTYLAQKPGGGNYAWNLGSVQTNNLATWQSAVSQEAHSRYSTTPVNNDGTLPPSSPAIGAGTNLTSLGIVGLNSDMTGKNRPSNGSWDAGAYSSGTAATVTVAPPTNLKATVQ
jgi:hypothetical protein